MFVSVFLTYFIEREQKKKMFHRAKILSLYEKCKLLDELNHGMSVTEVAKKYGVAKSTVCGFKNQEARIRQAVSNTLAPDMKFTVKHGDFPIMEKELYEWFLRKRRENIDVSGTSLKEKAVQLNNIIKEKETMNFNANVRWVQRFKKRHGISFVDMCKIFCLNVML